MTQIPPPTHQRLGAWSGTYSNMTPAEVYRCEADRLRTMAESMTYSHVCDGFLDMARQYDVLAEQAESISGHSFGQPFRRRSGERTR